MKILVTGGAGFIGRWIVKKLLDEGYKVCVLDDLSNGRRENIAEFKDNPDFEFVSGDIQDKNLLEAVFKDIDLCIHAAAAINVQESIDDPQRYYDVNVNGTFNILEAARNRNKKNNVKVVLIGTCMVYDLTSSKAINEEHPLNPKSPYAGSKLAAENLALSYYHAYGLPVVITRPFNTYGPYQKSDMEGGVVSIFIKSLLEGEQLNVFGDGTQTRDLLYVEDCAEFIVNAAFNEKAVGEVINGGYGQDLAIKDLALLICKDAERFVHVKHHHPQSEIPKLLCDYTKAKKFLGGWVPKTSLEEGIEKTKAWIRQTEQ
ncbi:MAG: SDR family NAD(P)-dependent oxidoreductase [Methanophagales archaeon]|nr:SDR family NAD(P)-dependent oxidoreductase [Methanophagales archaeon]